MGAEKIIGERLRQERERLNMNQTAFAESAGLTRKTQYSYEQGEASPGAMYLVKVAELGVDLAYVLTGVHSSPELARKFQAAASATLSESSAAGLSTAGVRAAQLSDDEAALLSSFRNMPIEQQESFLQIIGALSSKHGARPRTRKSSVKQVIHGDVGQVIKTKGGPVKVEGGFNFRTKAEK